MAPGEVLAPDGLLADQTFTRTVELLGRQADANPVGVFRILKAGARDLKACLGVADLAGFGTFSRAELAAIAAVLKYVDLTQMGRKPLVRAPRKAGGDRLFIDAASRASLELVKAASGDKASTLLGAIDRTVTAGGARELQARLSSPLSDPDAIDARLDAVSYLLNNRS